MFKLYSEKAEESEVKLPTSIGSSRKQEQFQKKKKKREFQKNICFIDYTKVSDCVDHNKLWKNHCVDHNKLKKKFFKRWEYQTTWPASWENYIQVKKQQVELDTEQHGSRLGKECVRL